MPGEDIDRDVSSNLSLVTTIVIDPNAELEVVQPDVGDR